MVILFILFTYFTFVNSMCYYGNWCCNDMEMFEQCNYAQVTINNYCDKIINVNQTYALVNAIPQLNCSQNIVCCTSQYNNGNDYSYYCQNMNSYKACINSISQLDEFIRTARTYGVIPENLLVNKPTITCQKKLNVYEYTGSATVNKISAILIIVLVLII
jgi:hypothetical protein